MKEKMWKYFFSRLYAEIHWRIRWYGSRLQLENFRKYQNFRIRYLEQFIAFFGCFPAFPRYFLCIKLNRKDCYSVIVFIRMIVMRTVQPISEKTLNFASMLFWKLLYFHNNSVDRMFDILFSSRWGKFWPKVIQNRLVFRYFFSKFYSEIHRRIRWYGSRLQYRPWHKYPDIFWDI